MNEEAMRYEYIIRAAHNVGRYGIPAANQDLYSGLESSFIKQRDNNDNQKDNELQFNYGFHCGEVAASIDQALWQFEKDYKDRIIQIDKDDLAAIRDLLNKGKIEQISESIEIIKSLFNRHGLVIL